MFTKDEQGLIEWLLRNEASRCRKFIRCDDLAQTWKESYQRRLDCARTALDKVSGLALHTAGADVQARHGGRGGKEK